MAYSAQTGALRRREAAVNAQNQYAEINEAGKIKAIEDAKKAGRIAVGLKSAETVHDLLEKGSYRKNKLITEKDWFKESTVQGSSGDEISLFSKGGDGDPGLFDGFLLPDRPSVNPDAYTALGEKIHTLNPDLMTDAGIDITSGADVQKKFFTTVGRESAEEIAANPTLTEFTREGALNDTVYSYDADMVTDASALVEGEKKITEGLGMWGKLGDTLGPAMSLLSLGTGVHTMLEGDTTEEKVLGGAGAVSGLMTGTGAAIAYTGGTAALAGTLTTTAATNFWNPVGWGIGIGAGLYGIGKGTGLF